MKKVIRKTREKICTQCDRACSCTMYHPEAIKEGLCRWCWENKEEIKNE